jgi:ubiquinone/menaquinone biosynthesis C-methylase UbiE
MPGQQGTIAFIAFRSFLKRWLATVFIFRNPFKIREYWKIRSLLKRRPEGLLLDVGCGVGLQAILLSRRFRRTIGVDVNEQFLAKAMERTNRWNRDRIQFLCGDLLDLRLPSASVEAVVSFSVLNLIPHWQDTLDEVFRLLKPGGQMVICVHGLEATNDPELVKAHRAAYPVQQYFSAPGLEKTLRNIGFARVEVQSLFTSRYAERLFAKGIRKNFRFSRIEQVFATFKLGLCETHPGQKSICLVVDATK